MRAFVFPAGVMAVQLRSLQALFLSVRRHGGTLAGLSRALQLIEEVVVRTSPQRRALYQGERLGTTGTAELLRLVPLPCELPLLLP